MKRNVFVTLLILAILSAVWFLRAKLEYRVALLIQRELIALFEKETGCHASLGLPELSFLPIGATAKDVEVKLDDGDFVRAERIDAHISFLPLLSKQIELRNITLRGMHVRTYGDKGSLMRVLDFLLEDDPTPPPPNPPWHAFISRGWKARVKVVRLVSGFSGTLDEPGASRFGYPGVTLDWGKADIRFTIYPGAEPTKVEATAGRIRSTFEGGSSVAASTVELTGKVDGSGLTDTHGKLETETLPGWPGGTATFQGNYFHRPDRKLDFTINGETDLAPVFSLAQVSPPATDMSGVFLGGQVTIGGTVKDTVIRGTALPLRAPQRWMDLYRCLAGQTSVQFEVIKGVGLTLNEPKGILASGTVTIPNEGHDASVALAVSPQSINDRAAECDDFLNSPDVSPKLRQGIDLARESLATCTLKATGTVHTSLSHAAANVQLCENRGADKTVELSVAMNEQGVSLSKDQGPKGIVGDLGLGSSPVECGIPSLVPCSGALLDLVDKSRGAGLFRWDGSLNEARDFELTPVSAFRILSVLEHFGLQPPANVTDLLQPATTVSGRVVKLETADIAIPRGQGEIVLLGAHKEGLPPFSATATIASNGIDTIALSPLLVESAPGHLTGTVTLTKASSWSISADARMPDLSLGALLPGTALGGACPVFDVTLSASGALSQPSASLRANPVGSKPSRSTWCGDASAEAAYTAKGFQGTLTLYGGRAVVTAKAPPLSSTPVTVEADAKVSDLPLGEFMKQNAAQGENHSSGDLPESFVLSANGRYAFHVDAPLDGQGSIQIASLTGSDGANFISKSRPAVIALDGGRALFQDTRFVIGDKAVALDGFLDRRSGWNASVNGQWNVSELVRGLGPLSEFEGDLSVAAALSGNPTRPDIHGKVSLGDGRGVLEAGSTTLPFSAVQAHGTWDKDRFALSDLHGELAYGTFQGSGDMAPLFGTDRQVNFSLGFANVILEPTDGFVAPVDGKLTFEKQGTSPLRIGGYISTSSATYEDTLSVLDLLRGLTTTLTGVVTRRGTLVAIAAKSQLSPKNGGAPVDVEFALKFVSPGGIRIDTPYLKAYLGADLLLEGSPDAPALKGTVRFVSGSIEIGSRAFDVVSGTLDFTPSRPYNDPVLSIVAETRISGPSGDEDTVRLIISGSLDKPKIDMRADSGLPPEQIFSQLGLNLGVSEVGVVSRRDLSQSLLHLIDPRSGQGLEERLLGITGFSGLRVRSEISQTTGEFVAKVTTERPVVGDLDLILGADVTEPFGSELLFRYPLIPFVQAYAGWHSHSRTNPENDSGGYGAELRYRRSFGGRNLVPPLIWNTPPKAESHGTR